MNFVLKLWLTLSVVSLASLTGSGSAMARPVSGAQAMQPSTAPGGIVRLDITSVESPTFDGQSFGNVGQYEKLTGRAYGEVDPNDPRNAVITDIGLAPRNPQGMVEYATDVMILKPVDMSKANHRLFYEPTNRGNILSFPQLNDARSGGNNPTTAADAGNGFLMTEGYTVLESGWDVTAAPGGGRFTTSVPVARNADGSTITGPAMEELVVDDDATRVFPFTYAAASPDKAQASLTVRERYEDPPVPISADRWEYTDDTLSSIHLLPDGTSFQRGTLYEFVYTARDPIVAGLGFAAIRDVAEFFRHADADEQGAPNPLAGNIQYVYTSCVSQPCRTMHDFVDLGFNQDAAGSRVVDGVLNWIGGGDGIFMNYRFAQPGRTQRQHIARWYPEFQFPFANQTLTDPVTGKTDGRLARCTVTDTCPDIFEANSENEYWSKDGAMLQVDPNGNDLPDPGNVRYFLMSSLPHGGGVPATGRGICQQTLNPLVANATLRALLVDLDQWVASGTPPPDSQMPRVADGTLVSPLPQDSMGFPSIPGVTYNGRMHTGDLFDFGPRFDQGILSILPPKLVGTPYPMLVPKTDADGNDIAGIRLPEVAAPLATYTGWALRANPPGANDGCDASGQKIDFPSTQADRVASGDPRMSIAERYPSHDAYVSAVTNAVNALRQQRLLLAADAQAYIDAAEASAIGR
jgi:alpha/beta hydrolase family protein